MFLLSKSFAGFFFFIKDLKKITLHITKKKLVNIKKLSISFKFKEIVFYAQVSQYFKFTAKLPMLPKLYSKHISCYLTLTLCFVPNNLPAAKAAV